MDGVAIRTIPANTPDRTNVYFDVATIDGTGTNFGATGQMRVKRIAASGTDPSNDPFFQMVGIHYEIDGFGSDTELTKI